MSRSEEEVLINLSGGLCSGLTYGSARSIKELQRKAKFVLITSNYLKGSIPKLHFAEDNIYF